MSEMKPLKIRRTNTILYCERWEATVRFYRDVLKLPVSMEKGWFVEFELNAHARLSVAQAARASVASAGGDGITLSWQVESLVALRARMVVEGIQVTPIEEIWGARTCNLFDPEGNRIELWS